MSSFIIKGLEKLHCEGGSGRRSVLFLLAKERGKWWRRARGRKLLFLFMHLGSHSPQRSCIGSPPFPTPPPAKNINESISRGQHFYPLYNPNSAMPRNTLREYKRRRVSTGTNRQSKRQTPNARPPPRQKCHSLETAPPPPHIKSPSALLRNGIPLGSSVMRAAMQKFKQTILYSCKIHLAF